ncbi:MAG: type II CRISPR-associated endonuclease Cas1 [Anaeroplasma sp.]
MSFRTVIVSSRCKLEYSLNYLVYKNSECEKMILLDEIKTLVIDSLQVSITSSLLFELMRKKIKVIFINDKHNPEGELVPYQNNFYSYRKIKAQMNILQEYKTKLWNNIVKMKIIYQAKNLSYKGKNDSYQMLVDYSLNIIDDDRTNREGHAAKVYFNSLFGKDFSRDNKCDINKYLNYGYSIILSAFNREIKILGFLTELGVHHIGESNSFNLSCDLMEPIRPLVDSLVIKNEISDENFKLKFIELLSKKVNYLGKEIFLDNAIKLYVEDLMGYLMTGDERKINFIDYEL